MDDLRLRILYSFGEINLNTFPKRLYFDHHLCHAASALIPSKKSRANIISLDGWGGTSSGILGWVDENNSLQVAENLQFRSWGALYNLISKHLGFGSVGGEGKTMGLAPYGEVRKDLLPDFCETEMFIPQVDRYAQWLKEFPIEPQMGAEPSSPAKHIACTLQNYYERSLISMAKFIHKKSQLGDFVMAGGVALNCTANGKLAQEPFVNSIFVQPASHDAGTALGAAILAHGSLTGKFPDIDFLNAYWGPEYSSPEIRKTLEDANVKFIQTDPTAETARALANDLVVGFFQGRSEVGPRALGNRSILANPMRTSTRDRVNAIKKRETWRPLAPSILAHRFHEVFESRHESPYMLLAAQVHSNWREKIPAVVHVDGSARPQSVTEKSNSIFYKTIEAFEKLTGIPLVLNTSFNLNDEPIVETPRNALATFFASGLDVLVMGDFCIYKNWETRTSPNIAH